MSLLQLHEEVDRISATWLLNFRGHVENYLGISIILHSTLYSRFVVGPKSSGEVRNFRGESPEEISWAKK